MVTAPPVSVRQSPVPLLRQAEAAIRLDAALRRGDVRRVARGVFAPADRWKRLTRWDRYLARVHAHALTHPNAVFALESAAALTGVPIAGSLDEVHVLTNSTAARLVDGVRSHVTADARTVHSEGGILFVSPVETAVDIARVRHPAAGLMAADAVLRLLGDASPDVLIESNEGRRSGRGRGLARWALARASARAESSLESVSRAVAEWLGYPPPELQVVFDIEGADHRVDMFWPDENVVGEADGRIKYDGTLGDGAKSLWAEKQREDALRRRVRGFARWGHSQVLAVEPFDDILRSAGLRPDRPRDSFPLLTLRRALTPGKYESAPRIQG